MTPEKHLDNLITRYPQLSTIRQSLKNAYNIFENCFSLNAKLLIAGNGGSAADAEHIVGELMKGFMLLRKVDADFSEKLVKANDKLGEVLSANLQGALPAIALDGHFALSTAFANDRNPCLNFAQQLYGYGSRDDVFLAISTSGNSENILYAAAVARAKGMMIVGLTGQDGGNLTKYADVCIKVPETETYKIQELHLPVYHCLCQMLEERFYGG